MNGFLPLEQPLAALPDDFAVWEGLASELPGLLGAGVFRRAIDSMPELSTDGLAEGSQVRRAMLLLSYFGHAYVWGSATPPLAIPAQLARPWSKVAQWLGRPPVLSYGSYALDNWRKLDAGRPVELGNIVLLQEFLGGIDEQWFILVHVEIEAKAAKAMSALFPAEQHAKDGQLDQLTALLTQVGDAVESMYSTLLRMTESCDPYIYYHRVRPYIHGWRDHPAIPRGIVYEGVDVYQGKPQQFRGETGAQSSIVPALDAALGISHAADPLRPYLLEMRDYMPPQHREFIGSLEQGSSIRDVVIANKDMSALKDAYNRCLVGVERFRTKHLEYAATYIFKQSQSDPSNPTDVGTGGTPFMPYLKKHRDETGDQLIP